MTCVVDVFTMRKLQRETKDILDNFLRLNTQLEMKQNLELEIKVLTGKLQVMEVKQGDVDPESWKKIDELKKELSEKVEELSDAESFNQDLMNREKVINDELREAREALISVCHFQATLGFNVCLCYL